jgi:CheY-like chemotaxis protein
MKRVLICDDDAGISEMMKIMLESEGYEVEVLDSGKGIQKRVKKVQPDIILIDLWMPGLDGKEAVKLLRTDPQTSNIPIIVVSALHENELNQIAKKIGVESFLPKPFDMLDLIALVQKYISFSAKVYNCS